MLKTSSFIYVSNNIITVNGNIYRLKVRHFLFWMLSSAFLLKMKEVKCVYNISVVKFIRYLCSQH